MVKPKDSHAFYAPGNIAQKDDKLRGIIVANVHYLAFADVSMDG